MRIHFLASTIVVLLGFYFSIEAWEWCILILVSTLVISLELINSGIENLVDLVTLEQNLMARKVKDIAAAAVLIRHGFFGDWIGHLWKVFFVRP